MRTLETVKQHLEPGGLYRRAELAQWSNAVDRHLQRLQKDGVLTKLSGGLYYCPAKTVFGPAPAEEKALVRAFLKDDRFLLNSPNFYNALGVGTTQLYNETVVYNHKRHGRFKLGGREFRFVLKPYFPEKLTPEFMLVDVVNNLSQLAEDTDKVLEGVRKKALSMNHEALSDAVRNFGGVRARKFFAKVLNDDTLKYVV